MAFADLDNDGDLDVVINNLNGVAGIYRNETAAPRLAVRLKGRPPNTRGIGAKIKILGGPVTQAQEIICGGRYLSSDEPMRVFAAGEGDMRIEVAWRSGTRSVVTGVRENRIYEIDEGGAMEVQSSKFKVQSPEAVDETAAGTGRARLPTSWLTRTLTPPNASTLFEDVSDLIKHTHHDEPFDDFALQPLLPKRLSQSGPGVSWFDVDGDGWEDLIVGSGRGGRLAVYLNDRHGGFTPYDGAPVSQTVTRDQTAILGWRNNGGPAVLLVGSSNYEDGLTNGGALRQYDFATKTLLDDFPGQDSSTGPLAMADIDGDGNLDLFVGGRSVPRRYPEPASSLIFRGTGTGWAIDTENTKRLAQVGLVSGAVFSDLDGDGDPDLILACDWAR
ncbi:MAG: hypothetical protein DME26_11495 [Verrucomicrobia bacterium]|nr:MAG: hypothetical protein DME26_11495 [Verrucomicrobiota bacterium]